MFQSAEPLPQPLPAGSAGTPPRPRQGALPRNRPGAPPPTAQEQALLAEFGGQQSIPSTQAPAGPRVADLRSAGRDSGAVRPTSPLTQDPIGPRGGRSPRTRVAEDQAIQRLGVSSFEELAALAPDEVAAREAAQNLVARGRRPVPTQAAAAPASPPPGRFRGPAEAPERIQGQATRRDVPDEPLDAFEELAEFEGDDILDVVEALTGQPRGTAIGDLSQVVPDTRPRAPRAVDAPAPPPPGRFRGPQEAPEGLARVQGVQRVDQARTQGPPAQRAVTPELIPANQVSDEALAQAVKLNPEPELGAADFGLDLGDDLLGGDLNAFAKELDQLGVPQGQVLSGARPSISGTRPSGRESGAFGPPTNETQLTRVLGGPREALTDDLATLTQLNEQTAARIARSRQALGNQSTPPPDLGAPVQGPPVLSPVRQGVQPPPRSGPTRGPLDQAGQVNPQLLAALAATGTGAAAGGAFGEGDDRLGNALLGGAAGLGLARAGSQINPENLAKAGRGLTNLRREAFLSGTALPKNLLTAAGALPIAALETGSTKPLRQIPRLAKEVTQAAITGKNPIPLEAGQVPTGPFSRRIGAVDAAAERALRDSGLDQAQIDRALVKTPLRESVGGDLAELLQSPGGRFVVPFQRTPFDVGVGGFNELREGLGGPPTRGALGTQGRRRAVTAGTIAAGAGAGSTLEGRDGAFQAALIASLLGRRAVPFALGATAAGGRDFLSGISPVPEFALDPRSLVPTEPRDIGLVRLAERIEGR